MSTIRILITFHLSWGPSQTREGRAVPCFVESTFAHDIPSFGSRHSSARTDKLRKARQEERKEQSFSAHIISTLDKFIKRLNFAPRFAFDRGFGSSELIGFLDEVGAIFYVRLKAGRIVDDGYRQIQIRDITDSDEVVELDGILLRVIRSNRKERRRSHSRESWYILTNDFKSSRDEIIRIYYHRFEIEESFRDMKHIFDIKRVRFDRPNSLKVVLVLVFIGFALLYRWSKYKTTKIFKRVRNIP